MRKSGLLFLLSVLCSVPLPGAFGAQIHTDLVEYKHGDTTLEGFIAYEDTEDIRPAVIVVHEWMGLNQYAQKRAVELAEMGYVAFAIDMYGKGVRPSNRDEAAAQASIYKSDRALMRARAAAGLKVIQAHPLVDQERIAAIGYCFGGGVALEMARASLDLAGVVSFHGNLDTPDPLDANNIKGKVLVCHGADDPYVPEEEVIAFQKEMRDSNADWQMISYGNAVHAFTNPDSGSDPTKGAAYDAKADHRSWTAMTGFFEEVFAH